MSVVDSSAWLEYFDDGPNAAWFADSVEDLAWLSSSIATTRSTVSSGSMQFFSVRTGTVIHRSKIGC